MAEIFSCKHADQQMPTYWRNMSEKNGLWLTVTLITIHLRGNLCPELSVEIHKVILKPKMNEQHKWDDPLSLFTFDLLSYYDILKCSPWSLVNVMDISQEQMSWIKSFFKLEEMCAKQSLRQCDEAVGLCQGHNQLVSFPKCPNSIQRHMQHTLISKPTTAVL